MRLSAPLRQVLSRYGPECQPTDVRPLGSAGGFSGAVFWQLHTPRGRLVLRRWPGGHPSPRRLDFIHAVLQHVASRGVDFVPVPVSTASRSSRVSCDGHLWELAPWMPGRANFETDPSRQRLQAALRALATFHRAAEDFPLPTERSGPPPGVARRVERFNELLAGGLDRLAGSVNHTLWPELAERAVAWCDLFRLPADSVCRELESLHDARVPLQPCIRDVWHDHVLFTGGAVTGIVDFGAMRIDNVATDLARLLGSLARDRQAAWDAGLAAYEELRPLSRVERRLVQVLDRSAVLLSGLNWIEWVFLERREFDNRATILRRLDVGLQRLQRLADSQF